MRDRYQTSRARQKLKRMEEEDRREKELEYDFDECPICGCTRRFETDDYLLQHHIGTAQGKDTIGRFKDLLANIGQGRKLLSGLDAHTLMKLVKVLRESNQRIQLQSIRIQLWIGCARFLVALLPMVLLAFWRTVRDRIAPRARFRRGFKTNGTVTSNRRQLIFVVEETNVMITIVKIPISIVIHRIQSVTLLRVALGRLNLGTRQLVLVLIHRCCLSLARLLFV